MRPDQPDIATVERDTAGPMNDLPEPATPPGDRYVWAVVRLSLGWIFLWGFLDKTFGLGVDTERADAWLDGASPATGFLAFGTRGPFAEAFQGMAGSVLVDWLYMLGLLALGVALVLGIGLRVAAVAGSTLLVMIWSAGLWPERNPFMDEHLIYSLVLVGLAVANAGDTWASADGGAASAWCGAGPPCAEPAWPAPAGTCSSASVADSCMQWRLPPRPRAQHARRFARRGIAWNIWCPRVALQTKLQGGSVRWEWRQPPCDSRETAARGHRRGYKRGRAASPARSHDPGSAGADSAGVSGPDHPLIEDRE